MKNNRKFAFASHVYAAEAHVHTLIYLANNRRLIRGSCGTSTAHQ